MGYNTLTVTFDTISDLVSYTGQQPNEQVNVLGYYAPGDEGGGTFYWNAASTQSEDLGIIFKATGITTGRWVRIFNESIYVRWFGISPTDFAQNTINFQKAVNTAADVYPLRLGEGTITINGSIKFTKSPRVYGSESYKTTIQNVSTSNSDDTFSIDNSPSTITWGWLEGFTILGSATSASSPGNGNGIYCNLCGRISFTDILSIGNGRNGFFYNNSWTPFFMLCRAEANQCHGVKLVGGTPNAIHGAIFVTGSFSRNFCNGIFVDNAVAGTPAISAYSVTFSGNICYGLEVTSGSGITLVDPYFEYNIKHHIYCHNASVGQIKALNIVGSGYFSSDSAHIYIVGSDYKYTPTEFIYLENVQNVQIEKTSFVFNDTSGGTTTAIFVTGDCFPAIGEISKSIVSGTLITHNLNVNSGNLVTGEVLSKNKRYTYLSDQWWLSLGKGSTGTEMMEGYFASDNGGERAVLSFAKSAGTLSAMNDITGNSDIASILFKSYEAASTSFKPIAEIKSSTTGAQTTTSKPSKIEFQTTALNSATRRPAFIIRPDGLIELPISGSGIILKQADGTSQTIQLTAQGELIVVGKPRTLSGTADPTVIPNFLGQMYINTTAKTAFVAVGTTAATDWKSI